jgi:hypothetical protein
VYERKMATTSSWRRRGFDSWQALRSEQNLRYLLSTG